jgi:hypothetical protein
MANLWCIETNTGYLSAHTPDYLDAEQPYPALAEGRGGLCYLIDPAWPRDADGEYLPPDRVTLAADGVNLREKREDEMPDVAAVVDPLTG